MKVVGCRVQKEFEPIKIEITIENQEELDSLIARLSIHTDDINNAAANGESLCRERATLGSCATLLQKLELLKG